MPTNVAGKDVNVDETSNEHSSNDGGKSAEGIAADGEGDGEVSLVIPVPSWLRKLGNSEMLSIKLSDQDSIADVRSMMSTISEFSAVSHFDLALARSGVVLAPGVVLADIKAALPDLLQSESDDNAEIRLEVVTRPYTLAAAQYHVAYSIRLFDEPSPPGASPCLVHALADCDATTAGVAVAPEPTPPTGSHGTGDQKNESATHGTGNGPAGKSKNDGRAAGSPDAALQQPTSSHPKQQRSSAPVAPATHPDSKTKRQNGSSSNDNASEAAQVSDVLLPSSPIDLGAAAITADVWNLDQHAGGQNSTSSSRMANEGRNNNRNSGNSSNNTRNNKGKGKDLSKKNVAVGGIEGFEVSDVVARVAGLQSTQQSRSSHHALSGFSIDDMVMDIEHIQGNGVVEAQSETAANRRRPFRQVAFSEWNPPTDQRRMAGDLFYLSLVTAENKVFEITASVDGFFLNGSSRRQFVAEAQSAVNPTLLGLVQQVSPKFADLFQHACMRRDDALATLVRSPVPLIHDRSRRWLPPPSASLPGQLQERKRDRFRAGHWAAHTCAGYCTAVATSAPTDRSGSGELNPCADCACSSSLDSCAVGSAAACDLARGLSSDGVGGALPWAALQRDWHDEFNSLCEQPVETARDLAIRANLMNQLYTDFVTAARAAVLAIARGDLMPLNPLDSLWNRLYYSSGIVISYASQGSNFLGEIAADGTPAPAPLSDGDALDARLPPAPVSVALLQRRDQPNEPVTEESLQETLVGWKCVANDMMGIQRLLNADVPGVSYILMCTVDVCGWRMLAQSVIPGIIRDQENMIRYGTLDFGESLRDSDPDFCQLADQVGIELGMARHSLQDAQGVCHPDHRLPVETKGVRALDGRRLFVDWMRPTPVDASQVTGRSDISPAVAMTRVVRPELLDIHKQIVDAELRNAAAKRPQADGKSVDQQPVAAPLAKDPPRGDSSDSKQTQKEGGDTDIVNDTQPTGDAGSTDDAASASTLTQEFAERTHFCVNALTPRRMHYDSTQQQTSTETALGSLSRLVDQQLKRVVLYATPHNTMVPWDGEALVDLMHRCGVNARHLGQLAARYCTPDSELHTLATRAMVARAAKALLFARLRARHPWGPASSGLGQTVAQFLNAVVVQPSAAAAMADAAAAAAASDSSTGSYAPADPSRPLSVIVAAANAPLLDPKLCWQALVAEMDRRFPGHRFGGTPAERARLRGPALVREICRQTGVVLAGRQYQLNAKSGRLDALPFRAEDVLALDPKVKRLQLPVKQTGELIREARRCTQRGDGLKGLQEAFDLSTKAQMLLEQANGMLNADMVECLGFRARLLANLGQPGVAALLQIRATIVCERVFGLDAYQTADAYTDLVPLLCNAGAGLAALRCSERLLRLTRLLQAPASLRAQSAGVHSIALQQCGYPALAVHYSHVLVANESPFRTSQTLMYALRRLAETHLLANDGRAAVSFAKQLVQLLRSQASRSQHSAVTQAFLADATALLQQCVQAAVSSVRAPQVTGPSTAGKKQDKGMSSGSNSSINSNNRRQPQTAASGSSSDRPLGSLSVDEIMAVIEPKRSSKSVILKQRTRGGSKKKGQRDGHKQNKKNH